MIQSLSTRRSAAHWNKVNKVGSDVTGRSIEA
jgi:hypothetical protein